VAFGDIFLEDLKSWREEQLAALGLVGLFPIWKVDSGQLVREFIDLGFRSVVCCVNDAYLDDSVLGRTIDAEFLAALPADVDPSGENGEFHSFTFGGPIFKHPIGFGLGPKIYRPVEETHPGTAATAPVAATPGKRQTKGFWFCDLIPS
jgi:diphthamide synthase (EF-2-diphthine--ammonia ligase)